MICLANEPELLADPTYESADSYSFSPDIEELPAGDLPLWQSRPIATLDWPESVESSPTSTITRLFWRGIVANWSLKSRQEWGDLANQLQDGGLDWKTAERTAFEQIMERRTRSRN
jgi:hypothetical protein